MHIESRICLAILKSTSPFILSCTGILEGYSSEAETTAITTQENQKTFVILHIPIFVSSRFSTFII